MAARLEFVFDYKTPHGYLGFGYQKKELPEIIQYLSELKSNNWSPQIIHCGRTEDLKITHASSHYVEELLREQTNSSCKLTAELDGIDSGVEYLIPFESVHYKTHFSEFKNSTFNLDDCFSKRLLKKIKKYPNFRLFFIDAREGSYYIDDNVFLKMQKWLDLHNITHKNKIIISTCDDKLQKKLPNDFRFSFFNNDSYISVAGNFVLQAQKNHQTLVSDRKRDNYNYDIKKSFEEYDLKKYFLMFNRNTARMHRPYFVGRLIEENLLDKGYVSLFKNTEFEHWIDSKKDDTETSRVYGIDITTDMLKTIYNCRQTYPYYIDENDGDRVANFHNFLSDKTPYVESLFSIVGETNASSDFLFVTEKTLKPIMNLHPFFVVGNPGTLKKLKQLGFKTFDKIWNEDYDSEENFEKRVEMIIKEVKLLCELSLEELREKISKIKNICIYNREQLVKLYYENHKYKTLLKCLKKTVI